MPLAEVDYLRVDAAVHVPLGCLDILAISLISVLAVSGIGVYAIMVATDD